MLNLKINYYSHLLLNSKYKIIINILIYILIYLFSKNNTYAFCMIADNALPSIAETKNIIESNIESKMDASKDISFVIGSLSEKIKELEQQLDTFAKDNKRLEDLLEESGYMNDMDGDDYNYGGWFRESDDDPRW